MKLSFTKPIYQINDNKITAKVDCTLCSINKKGIKETVACFTKTASTICTKDDKFDINKGCKIVLAKVEMKAYKHAITLLKPFVSVINYMYNENKAFLNNANNYIEHNVKYIENLTK